MKKYLIALIAVATLLTGCEASAEVRSEATESVSSMFVLVEETYNWSIVYHRETKVMYAVSDGGYNQGSFTVMLNPDGTPQLWDGEA